MIHLLFGTWRRRIVTLAACILAFLVSFTTALVVAVRHSPASAESALKVPVLGPLAVSIAGWRQAEAPSSKTAPAAAQDVKTFRDLRPLSAGEIAQLIQNLKDERKVCLDKMQEVEREKKRVELYRAEIAKEREQLLALREKVVSQWDEIKKARAALDRQVTEIQSLEGKNLKQLATSYESMKPDRAALILKKLEETTAAKTLYLMKERAAAKIIEQLDQETAAKLTERMMLLKQVN